jgi:predicted dinucleotide-binding enzyme
LAKKAKPPEAADRIAIPVAADNDHDRKVTMSLVNDTGLDAVDAGPLADSWRQQPGAPVYCTDPSSAEIGSALKSDERDFVTTCICAPQSVHQRSPGTILVIKST